MKSNSFISILIMLFVFAFVAITKAIINAIVITPVIAFVMYFGGAAVISMAFLFAYAYATN